MEKKKHNKAPVVEAGQDQPSVHGGTDLQKQINETLWRACDTFRGVIDPSLYKEYLLTMLFVKYVSDRHTEKREELLRKYKGDTTRVERALSRDRFRVPKEAHFESLHLARAEDDLGERINIALAALEEENRDKLEGVFRNIDFNSEANLGRPKERNGRLQKLLDDFADPRLDLRPSRVGHLDVIGNSYEFLIGKFAAGAGKKAGEFYTPPEVSTLLTRLLKPEPGMRICDPACGSGSLLIKCGAAIGPDDRGIRNVSLYGMEANGQTWSLCKMNMFLHEFDQADIHWCDTIRNPDLVEQRGGQSALMHFDIVVANPPFSLDKWGEPEKIANDPFHRFDRGIPPKSRGDYAFILHMIEAAKPGTGRVAVVCPHGVLFRAGAEAKIRQKLVDENLLDAVVGLPPNLFYGTGIPAVVLVFDNARNDRSRTDVVFVDASHDCADDARQNKLRPQDIEKITDAIDSRKDVERYAHVASLEEIASNDYNLNIPRYVDTFEEEEQINLAEVQLEIKRIEAELARTHSQLASYLKELGI